MNFFAEFKGDTTKITIETKSDVELSMIESFVKTESQLKIHDDQILQETD